MDDCDLQTAFSAHTAGQTHFTRRMAIVIANMADQTPRSLVLRLERTGLLRAGSWEWFLMNGGITPEHVSEVRNGA